jgi:hypothetical protein
VLAKCCYSCTAHVLCVCVCLLFEPVLCVYVAAVSCAVNRRMDQWVDTSDFDLNTLEVQLEEVGPDGK